MGGLQDVQPRVAPVYISTTRGSAGLRPGPTDPFPAFRFPPQCAIQYPTEPHSGLQISRHGRGVTAAAVEASRLHPTAERETPRLGCRGPPECASSFHARSQSSLVRPSPQDMVVREETS